MHAFIALGAVKQATLQMVAPGIAEALIATAIGLFAAIPAVMAYNRLNQRVNKRAELRQLYGRVHRYSASSGLLQRQQISRR